MEHSNCAKSRNYAQVRFINILFTYLMTQVEGNIVDIQARRIYPGIISIENGLIKSIEENNKDYNCYIAPGFIDAHVHIESSMLLPEEFAKIAIQKGSVSLVNDPHEIANVLGVKGIEFMLEHAQHSLIKMFFTIPSCVPSTSFDATGAKIDSFDVKQLIENNPFVGLSEVMDVPGVLSEDPEMLRKIQLALQHNLVIDGHAPGLGGEELRKYISSGISTDHECTNIKEALEKIRSGMKILIREGSAAKNYESLKGLISDFSDHLMFCTDDSHPGDLIFLGHIDKIVKRAIADGYDLFDVLKIACLNPIFHYKLDVGYLNVGDSADFALFEDLVSFKVIATYINGEKRFDSSVGNCSRPEGIDFIPMNHFNHDFITISDIQKEVSGDQLCIKILDNEIITERMVVSFPQDLNYLESDLKRDILKIVYINRYENKSPQVAFIHGMGLKRGALATSISHDSHNIIAVGTNDHELTDAINGVIEEKGGLCVIDKDQKELLPLPIGGIMTSQTGPEVAESWATLKMKLREMGCPLESPFMTLSFMALIVIPELKIGEKGLFEFSKFAFVSA